MTTPETAVRFAFDMLQDVIASGTDPRGEMGSGATWTINTHGTPAQRARVPTDMLAPVLGEQARINAGETEARAGIEAAQANREEEMTAWRAQAAACRSLFKPEPPPPGTMEMPQRRAVSGGPDGPDVIPREQAAEQRRRGAVRWRL